MRFSNNQDTRVPCGQRAQPREHDLASVRVTGEHPGDIQRRGFEKSPRVVGGKKHRRPASANRAPDIACIAGPEPDARQCEGVAVLRDGGGSVAKHRYPAPAQRIRNGPVVVVIAEDGEHAKRCLERG